MTRISARQIAKFEAKLQEVTRDSVAVNHTLLARLAAKRDAHLAKLTGKVIETKYERLCKTHNTSAY